MITVKFDSLSMLARSVFTWISLGIFLFSTTLARECYGVEYKASVYPDKENEFEYGYGCRYFKVLLTIEGFGYVFPDERICSGYLDFESINERFLAGEDLFELQKENDIPFDPQSARLGIEIESIKVNVAGDKALVEWQEVPQGNGAYVDYEYRVFKRGTLEPLVADGVLAYGTAGPDVLTIGDITVKSFDENRLVILIESGSRDAVGIKKPLYYYDPERKAYFSEIHMEKEVAYDFSEETAHVERGSARYIMGSKDTLEEVGQFFGYTKDKIRDLGGGIVEFQPTKKRFDYLFPVRKDGEWCRSLYDLFTSMYWDQ